MVPSYTELSQYNNKIKWPSEMPLVRFEMDVFTPRLHQGVFKRLLFHLVETYQNKRQCFIDCKNCFRILFTWSHLCDLFWKCILFNAFVPIACAADEIWQRIITVIFHLWRSLLRPSSTLIRSKTGPELLSSGLRCHPSTYIRVLKTMHFPTVST